MWLTADLIDCEEINYINIFSEIKILFNIWIKTTITPLGKIVVLKSLILSKIVQLWMLQPNCTDRLQTICFKFYGPENRISRKKLS